MARAIGKETTGKHTPSAFVLSAAGLGQQWCFYLTRKRLGVVRDSPLDMAAEFAELIRLGHAPQKLQAAIAEKCRDRGEHFWQFKERIVGKASKPSAPRPKATFDPETVKPQPPEDQEKSRKIMAEARAKIGRMPQ